MTSITSPSKVRAYALEASREMRGGKFTRVSKEFLDRMESKLRAIVRDEVHRHPSVGRTLK